MSPDDPYTYHQGSFITAYDHIYIILFTNKRAHLKLFMIIAIILFTNKRAHL